MIKQIQKAFKPLILIGFFCNLSYASDYCSVYLSSSIMKSVITFESGLTKSQVVYSGYHLTSSASRVYRSADTSFVLKAFDASYGDTTYAEEISRFRNFSLPFLEMVRLRFLKDKGIIVPEVIDYSSSIFNTSGEPVVLVKSYVEGVAAEDLLVLDFVDFDSVTATAKFKFIPKENSGVTQFQADQLSNEIVLINKLIKDEFLAWLKEQSDLKTYYNSVSENLNQNINFDNFYSNWILTPEKNWVLIDP
jgi:hypothetical protein